jgi:4-amino-4-deoxy-L-arabinose transferase-like glycosyltransferase
MRYDESVTYVYFAGQPWATAISSYTYPNNHVFHTLLVKSCAALLGDDPWVLRIPAFLAGVAMIPMTFVVGRRLFGSSAALVGAGLVAGSGALVLYSTNARGYTMICLATLILADLLLRIRERSTNTFWIATVFILALGTWTVPVMLFPAGGLTLWFALSALRNETSQPRADLLRLGVVVIVAGVLTLLLYAPIIDREGWSALVGNPFVRGSSWRLFFTQLSSSLSGLHATMSLGLPVVVSIALGVCAIVGVVNERRANGIRVSLVGCVYVWCAVVLLVTHRTPFVRVWLFLLAPAALYVGHGLITVLTARTPAWPRSQSVALATGPVVATILGVAVFMSDAVETSRDTGTLRDADRIAEAFSGRLQPGDRVVAPIPSNAPLAYYFLRAGVDTSFLSSTPGDSSNVYLVINTGEGFTLGARPSDPLLARFTGAQLLARYPSAEVYRLY